MNSIDNSIDIVGLHWPTLALYAYNVANLNYYKASQNERSITQCQMLCIKIFKIVDL